MNRNYIYKPEDGIFEIKGRGGCLIATFEQCYPFDMGGCRYSYRATTENFSVALEHFFDIQYGGFDPTDKHQTELRRAIKTLTTLLDDQYVYTSESAANLLTLGVYARMKIVADKNPGPQRLALISPPAEEVAILNLLFEEQALDATAMASNIDLSVSSILSLLRLLNKKSYILRKSNGEYALTKAGFFLVCEMARLSTEPLDDARENLGWASAEERLVSISGFEKDYFFLSNFYAAPVCYDAIHYLNSEAAYQSWRCANREERIKFSRLFAAEAKNTGHHGIKTRSDWEEVKFHVMREVLHAKFEQNPDLAEKLALTYGYLCETNNWHDNVYGDCTCPACSKTSGQNMLGNLLMKERRYWRDRFRLQATSRISQEHEYRLFQEPFQKILEGKKDIELRLWDEKRCQLRIGDTIKFFGPKVGQWLVVEVQSLAIFPDFEYLFKEVDPKRCGFSDISAIVPAQSMRDYYSDEELDRHNVVAIGIRIIDAHERAQTQ